MNSKRITVLVLLILTGIAFLEGWLGIIPRTGGKGIHFSPAWDPDLAQSKSTERWSVPAEGVAELAVEEDSAEITITGGASENVEIVAEFTAAGATLAEAEELLSKLKLDVAVEGQKVKLVAGPVPNVQGRTKVERRYTVAVPEGIAVELNITHSSAELANVVGGVSLDAAYSAVQGKELSSDIQGSVSFTSLNLTEFRGSLELEASYSTVGLDLVDDPAGYDVYVEAAFGAVEGGLALERQQERNTLIARGVVHSGELPIQILSRFSTVKLNLK
jgi:hypothetical protein